ncbi:Putative ABC transporter substrate-binding protein [Candidatus Phycorickettsia trachydisci]|uniref:ABC transporter substrate-binding protein n=1 Tax=Candidatus Phycorickettsia trachydisci TaxID=2115978 RepID=A0A2P1P8M3_9RICK|nr:hypothetical protein [Candidatus Phycorickettsia trachydisci]AVP87595.1 Putative ABC transporter substrate-binding protein [Candidatus Phycorickettsia trachydisci]
MNIITLLTAFFVLSSCSSSPTSYQKSTNTDSINIAMLLSTEQEQKLITQGLKQHKNPNRKLNIKSYILDNNIDEIMKNVTSHDPNIILGPVFSKDTKQAASIAKDTPIISLSNDPNIAGGNVYAFGHRALEQTEAILGYLKTNDTKNFILLLPSNQKSKSLERLISNMLVKSNLALIKTEYYTLNQNNLDKTMRSILEIVDTLNDDPVNIAKPAIYISDEPENLSILFDAFRQYSLDYKAIICGENKIDIIYPNPIDLTFPGSVKPVPGFQNEHLTLKDRMYFDLGLLTGYAIGNESSDKKEFLNKINEPSGYVGIGGLIKFERQVAHRKYDIIQRKGFVYHTAHLQHNKLKTIPPQ